MGPGGALKAAVEARQQGLARFTGVTGHGWTVAAMHRRSLARFDFDSVLLPFNFLFAQNERYRKTFPPDGERRRLHAVLGAHSNVNS